MEQSEKFDTWGVVEVMGHKRFAGRITEQQIAGAALVRVDVPAVTIGDRTFNEFAKLIGVASIYCITPTTEDLARKAARALAHDGSAMPVYIPEERQLPAGRVIVVDDDDDDQGDEFFDDQEEACIICGCTMTSACMLAGGIPCSWVQHDPPLCSNPDCVSKFASGGGA